MPLGMADAYSKIGWAKEHLDTLKRELISFYAATPPKAYTITREDDVERERHIIKLLFHDIPPRICLIAGDAVYSMRAALDQTIWALARLKGLPGRTEFPIITVWNHEGRRRFANQVIGVPDTAIGDIQALQPYHRGDAFKGHPLWRLDEICNLDKHRRIPAHGTEVRGMISGNANFITHEATDNCVVVTIPLAQKDEIRFDPKPPVEVIFGGDSGITERFDDLMGIHNFVANEVLPRFNRFFP